MTKTYVSATKGSNKLACLPAEEITRLFILVGWIGQRRRRIVVALHGR